MNAKLKCTKRLIEIAWWKATAAPAAPLDRRCSFVIMEAPRSPARSHTTLGGLAGSATTNASASAISVTRSALTLQHSSRVRGATANTCCLRDGVACSSEEPAASFASARRSFWLAASAFTCPSTAWIRSSPISSGLSLARAGRKGSATGLLFHKKKRNSGDNSVLLMLSYHKWKRSSGDPDFCWLF